MAEVKKIKKSQNFLQLSGVLLETNLKLEEGVKCQAWSNKDGKMKDLTCDVIKKKDFKNPSLLLECEPKDADGNVIGTYQIGVDFNGIGFGIGAKQFDRETDKIVDNDNFKGVMTVLNTYVARKDAKDGEEPTRVFIKSGFLAPNEYANKEGEFKSYLPTITTYNVTSSGVPENDICEGSISGIIRAIKDEVFNDEETGRLKVDFYFFDSKGETYPVELTVEKDLADDFKDLYENGTSCKIYYDILTRQIGAKTVTSSNGGFGRREKHTVSGYTVNEYSVFKGEEPFEEENEYFIDKADMKKAMQSREITIEQKIKDAKDKADKPKTAKSGGLGNKASKLNETKVEESSDEEMPF